MTRPTRVTIDKEALRHNLSLVKKLAPNSRIIAMVKARAYGCSFKEVVPVLDKEGVWVFGVACLEEALSLRALGIQRNCLLMQGVFQPQELEIVAAQQFQIVIHHTIQLEWLLNCPMKEPIQVWVKVNTGMHRLGFQPHEITEVLTKLKACPWVASPIGLMTHMASADEPENPVNLQQITAFDALKLPKDCTVLKSLANSAAIMAFPKTHRDVVRPGIMLYGVSPFLNQTGVDLKLKPVMRFVSAITALHQYSAGASIGYGGTHQLTRNSRIAVVPVGYGDGYPRHIAADTPVWINGMRAPIVGRISMDIMTVDVTDCHHVSLGDTVELWGANLPIETIAKSAGTIPYELLCQFAPRVYGP
jgi:alanine racemase